MKRLLFGLLKLLVQLLFFALTGSWPRFADGSKPTSEGRTKSTPKRKRKKKQQGEASAGRPPLFQRGAARASRGAVVYGGEGPSLEEQLGREEGGIAMPRARTRPGLGGPGTTSERPTLGSVLRRPRGLRDAIVLGEALGPRRRLR